MCLKERKDAGENGGKEVTSGERRLNVNRVDEAGGKDFN